MAVVKWTMTDGIDTMTFQINPYNMDSPHADKNIQPYYTNRWLTISNPAPAKLWSFDGYVYNQNEYDKLVEWHQKDTVLELTDHLDRTWKVISENLDIKDRRNTAKNDTRYEYKWSVLNLGPVEVSS